MTSFEELCDQIVEYEKRFEERQTLLSTLRKEVKRSKDILTQELANERRWQGELMFKVDQSTEFELNKRSLAARESILLEQKKSLEEEDENLIRNLARATAELEGEMMEFCQLVDSRHEDLDLTAASRHLKLGSNARTLQRLLLEEQKLVKEIEEFERQKQTVYKLEMEKDWQQQVLSEALARKKELEEDIAKTEEDLAQLELQRERVATAPDSIPEFQLLQNDLRSLNTVDLERQCSERRQRAFQLQQQLYSHQRKQQLRQQQGQSSTQRNAPVPLALPAACTTPALQDSVAENELPDLLDEEFANSWGPLVNIKTAVSMEQTNRRPYRMVPIFQAKK